MAGRFTEKLADTMWNELDQQADGRLSEIIAECESLTTANCGWLVYCLKDAVIAVAKNILQLRQDAAVTLEEEVCYGTATLVPSAANEKSQEEELPF